MDNDQMAESTDRDAEVGCAPTADPRWVAGALLLPPILRILAEGHLASMERLAQELGLPSDLIVPTFSYVFPDTEFDGDGRLLGLGLSLVRTPHEVRLTGQGAVLYAWCALDALLGPMLMGESAQIISPCAATGQTITVVVGPEGVREARPASAVAAVVTETDPRHLRATGCGHQNFFASLEVATLWLTEHSHAVILPIAEAFRSLTRQSAGVATAPPHETVVPGEALGRLILVQLRLDGLLLDEFAGRLIAKEGERFSTASGQPAPGDLWWDPEFAGWLDSEAHQARGGGPHLIVQLPNGWDWDLDAPMSNGPGWWRTGEPPKVTALPSVIAEGYHGFLVQGKLYRLGGMLGWALIRLRSEITHSPAHHPIVRTMGDVPWHFPKMLDTDRFRLYNKYQ
ncbi:MAG TPA: organomercurial lyase [Chloroflexota bacterium]|nr:organomercurial lyase [Chloroflexota bacterium]